MKNLVKIVKRSWFQIRHTPANYALSCRGHVERKSYPLVVWYIVLLMQVFESIFFIYEVNVELKNRIKSNV